MTQNLRILQVACLQHVLTPQHSRPSRVYVTVGCPSVSPSVRLSHRSTAATVSDSFAAACRRYRSIAAGAVLQASCCGRGAQQQMRLASCWEPVEEAQRWLVFFHLSLRPASLFTSFAHAGVWQNILLLISADLHLYNARYRHGIIRSPLGNSC